MGNEALIGNARVVVQHGDIFESDADILIFKFAGTLYGADHKAAKLLKLENQIRLKVGEFLIVGTRLGANKAHIVASEVCFLGVSPLAQFRYEEIRRFGKDIMSLLAQERPNVSKAAMTIHGAGYGLDEREAVLSLLAGIADAELELNLPKNLNSILLVEHDLRASARIRDYVKEFHDALWARIGETAQRAQRGTVQSRRNISAELNSLQLGAESENKKHIFVAMPFSNEYTDLYKYGIWGPIKELGFLCERLDAEVYVGSVLQQIKNRIESSTALIAVLTGDNPNVYLEIGYAWGKGKPTILAIHKEHKARFDVQGERHLTYQNISDLEEQIKEHLEGLAQKKVI